VPQSCNASLPTTTGGEGAAGAGGGALGRDGSALGAVKCVNGILEVDSDPPVRLPIGWRELLTPFYNRITHVTQAPALPKALNRGIDATAVQTRYAKPRSASHQHSQVSIYAIQAQGCSHLI